MRLDNETPYCHSSLTVEPATKIVEHDKNAVEPSPLKADYKVDGREKHETACTLDNRTYKMNEDRLPTEKYDSDRHGDPPGSLRNINSGDSIYPSTNGVRDMVASCPIPGTKMEQSEKETYSYTDKNVMEFELPELTGCFKESNCHVVKDICIDEGVPSANKTLLENNADKKQLIALSHSGFDKDSALANEAVHSDIAVSDNLKSLNFTRQQVFDEEKKVGHPGNPESLLAEGGGNSDAADEAENKISEEMTVPEKPHVVQDSDSGSSSSDSSFPDGDELRQFDQGTGDNVNLSNCVGTGATVSDSCNCANDFPVDHKEDSASVTYDFDASLPVVGSSEEGAANADLQQSSRSLLASELDDRALDSLTGSTRSFFIQHGHGESSFSGTGSFSGPIIHSGPIPYSGSISLRSDSSTASTRSFAFPILHSEWNSSPVKMAKARKHRGWRVALCCRF